MKELIAFEEAQQIVLANAALLPAESTALEMSPGRTLAEPTVSRDDIPPFTNSAMDGFAVRAADVEEVPAMLTIIEDIPAGTFPTRRIEVGTCARIMTGAPVPDGADAVVPVEWTEPQGEGAVRILRAAGAGRYVRRAAEDVRRGDTVLPAGTVVTPPVVGILATLGYARVMVRRAPRVAVVATGDELVPPGAAPGPGQIRNANGPALAAQVRAAGGEPLPPQHARDDVASTRAAIEQALEADVIVLSGGVSVGAYDVVRRVLDDLGADFFFWRVRQRPGKPLAFGRLGGRLLFGLPGNPVSSAMCFEQYVRPALARMLGRMPAVRPRVPAVLEVDVAKGGGLHYFTRATARVKADGRLYVRDTGPQGSNLYSSVVRANCILHLPEALENPRAGTVVEIEWLAW